jgi:uncharacterized protein YggE
MISRSVTVLAATAAALTLTSCGIGSDEPDARTVTVVGNGEVRTAPDVLSAELGVSTSAPDVSTAIDRANERAKSIIDAVKGLGVAAEDIRTSQFTVSPDYTGPNATPSGYRVTNMVTVVVRDLDKASEVIDGAVRAGGDDARVNSVNFTLENDSEAITEARKRAFEDAKSRAQQYAELSELDLGAVVTIEEVTSASEPPVAFDSAEISRSSVPLEPGMQTVSFQVTVKWSLG